MLKNLRLRNKMLLLFLIPTMLILAAISYLSYNSAVKALDEAVRTSLKWHVDAENEKIEKCLVSKEALVNSAAAVIAHEAAGTDIRGLLASIKRSSEGITNVFVGFADGRYQDAAGWTPPAGYDPRTREWYKSAVGAKGIVYSDLYIDQSTKLPTISVMIPIKQNGQVIGVVGADLNLSQIKEIAQDVKSGKTGYAFVLDNKGNYLYHPTLTLSDNIFTLQNGVFAESGKAYLSGKAAIQRYTFGGVEKFYASAPIGTTGWAFVLGVPTSELFESLDTVARTAIIVSIIGLLVIALIVFFIARSIVRPIQDMSQIAGELAQGNLAVNFAGFSGGARDEIGLLTSAMSDMVSNLRGLVKQISSSAEQVAASSEQLTASSEQSAQASNQVAASISDVANGADEQLKAANETTMVMEQMSSGIQQVAANSNRVAEHSSQAADKAKEGGKAAEKAVIQMASIENTVNTSAQVVTKLGERSKEIGQIVDTISGIAGQTNLLALNAAIEAARAGEQGRGFAVVAEEVRKLAEQSQEAAKKIAELIGEIQGDTDRAVLAMNDGTREVKTGAEVVKVAGTSFREIAAMVENVSEQIRHISQAIQDVAVGSQKIVVAVNRIDDLSKKSAGEAQSVSAATEEQLASFEEIATSSDALAKLAQDLQTAVAKFRL